MGVKDLSKELRPSNKLSSHLSTFSGKIVGLDASIWLNKALFSSPEINVLFHQATIRGNDKSATEHKIR